MLDSKQCEAFLAVAEYASFEQASKILCLTAAAVSLRVQALEKHLGHLLIVRAKPLVLTAAGNELLKYLQHLRLQEQNLLQTVFSHTLQQEFISITLGVNADSLATWLLPYLQDFLQQEKLMLNLKLDDQAHTHELLSSGQVHACISAEEDAMKGCESHYLGSMTYRMMAHPHFIQRYFAQGLQREALRHAPAVIFNHKDHLHADFLQQHFGLMQGSYPCHFIPSSQDFVQMIMLGLGYGWLPEWQIQQTSTELIDIQLIDLMPKHQIKVPLYWHCWKQQPDYLKRMTMHLLTMSESELNSKSPPQSSLN